ncbi:hypothetical protein GCM10027570_37290 [Streptomonospora sediminis]
MTTRNVLLTVGSCLLLAAAVGGLVPLSAEGSSCGSAFFATNDAAVDDWTAVLTGGSASAEAACDSLRSVVLIPLVVLAALGTVLFLAGWTLPRTPQRKLSSSDEAEDD